MANLEAQVRELLEPLAHLHDATVEEVTSSNTSMGRILAVTVDDREGVEDLTSDQVADLARAFSNALDEADPVEGRYTLEVGTRGADRPLVSQKHYRRNLGRKVHVASNDGREVTGVLTEVTPDGFTVETKTGLNQINFEDARQTLLVIEVPKEG